MTLYEIKDTILKLLDIIDSELPEDVVKEAEQWLDTLTESFDEKAFNIARYVKNLDAEALACKNEKDRLAKRQKALEGKAKGLKQYLEIMMNRLGKENISDSILTIAMQNNPPSADVLEESKIDNSYFVPQDPVLDKKKLLADLKELETLSNGCEKDVCSENDLCADCLAKIAELKPKLTGAKIKRSKSLRIR